MREKEIKDISIVFDLRNKKIELFSTEIKLKLSGIFFFGGSRNKKFHVGHVEFETTIRLLVELGTHLDVHIWNSGQFVIRGTTV